MKQLLQEIAKNFPGFVELRYHKRISNSFLVQKGRVDVANHSDICGIGVRVYEKGYWGFSATTDLSRGGIQKAVEAAAICAHVLASSRPKNNFQTSFDRTHLATDDFIGAGVEELCHMALEDKLSRIIAIEHKLSKSSTALHSARCRYNELIEEKVIVTSDGAHAALKIAQPEVILSAIAEKQGEQISAMKGAGIAGGWQCLFEHPSLHNFIEETAKLTVDLLAAKYAKPGKHRVILDPAVVGLLCHEAIGHTVEADFVKAGSVARDFLGKTVASPLISMHDTGFEDFGGFAVANIPFDDEGIKTQNTTIIKEGKLVSFLHNRESAAETNVASTGNARAWSYSDEPLIRMRNTYIKPGVTPFTKMLEEMDEGYLIEGSGGGQADSNGEFMFGCSHLYRIKNGKKERLFREATISGIAFDVLKSVDAVSKEFRWDLGTGYCGKGQPAKVDAGGPYIRCKITIGGRE